MDLDANYILSLAPDPAAAAAGQKLARAAAWQHTGRDAQALWGECLGSALYQVRVDGRDFAAKCSCPSRKLPCKHSLGLLLLAASTPAAVPIGARPNWVATWLAGRETATQSRLVGQATQISAGPAQQAKRAEKRLALVRQGIDELDLWLRDLVREGLAGLELKRARFWERPAARLVDCQAPALALRVRRLAGIPGSSPHWPDDLLAALGGIALLTEAYSRLDSLEPALQADIRAMIGWTLKEDEVIAHDDFVHDRWLVCGQWVEAEPPLRTLRIWLHGTISGRAALVLQYSAAGSPFGVPFVSGSVLDATLAFWPSSFPLRAMVSQQHGPPRMLAGPIPGVTTIEEFLDSVSVALSAQPWLDRLPCLLRNVTTAPSADEPWQVIDEAGRALPLTRGHHWPLLAVSGGRPIDIAGEWQGNALLPLGMQSGDGYLACTVPS